MQLVLSLIIFRSACRPIAEGTKRSMQNYAIHFDELTPIGVADCRLCCDGTRLTRCLICGRSADTIKEEKVDTYMRRSTPRNEPDQVTKLRRGRL